MAWDNINKANKPRPSPYGHRDIAILYPCRDVRNGGLKIDGFLPSFAS